jgi:hypothetical protein
MSGLIYRLSIRYHDRYGESRYWEEVILLDWAQIERQYEMMYQHVIELEEREEAKIVEARFEIHPFSGNHSTSTGVI